jgi:hypothetical protein
MSCERNYLILIQFTDVNLGHLNFYLIDKVTDYFPSFLSLACGIFGFFSQLVNFDNFLAFGPFYPDIGGLA